jgi:Alginate lyase
MLGSSSDQNTQGDEPRLLSRRGFLLAALIIPAAVAAGVLDLVFRHEGAKKEMFRPMRLKPAQVVDLSVWKIGLPTTVEITNPKLEEYSDPTFEVVQAVQFTASCGDKAQAGSNYARSELREMNADGSPASWSSTSGTHTMVLTQRITHLPVVKPSLVCGQIHSTPDYLILVELTGTTLLVRYIDDVAGVLDANYQVGTAFDLRLVAADGYVDVFYNGEPKVHQAMDRSGCYFKAGCYLQSSTSTGDQATAYGQVEISSLVISHSD